MNEQAVSFGSNNRLVGVISAPADLARSGDRPAVLLLNAGLLHRVGPYRMYVDLARKLSAMGYIVLRFDLSGIGDSLQGDETRLYDERVLDNIKCAMDLLSTQRGNRKFVLMGLCAGADNAHKAAVSDPRVTGAVFFDGYGYRTWKFYLYRYLPKLLSPKSVLNFLKRQAMRVGWGANAQDPGQLESWKIFVRRFPPKDQVERELQTLIDRGVRLMYVYTGGVKTSYYNHRQQFHEMFRSVNFKGNAQTVYFDRAEHTFPSTADREALISTVCRWMSDHYG